MPNLALQLNGCLVHFEMYLNYILLVFPMPHKIEKVISYPMHFFPSIFFQIWSLFFSKDFFERIFKLQKETERLKFCCHNCFFICVFLKSLHLFKVSFIQTGINIFKVNNRKTRKSCEIYSKVIYKCTRDITMTLFWCIHC